MSEFFTLPILLGILYSGIRLATPYIYAAIGETFSQASGVLNLGVEGMMLIGAFSAFFVGMQTGNLWLGLLAAIVAGALMGLLMAVICITFQAKQGVAGIGITIFGGGLSSLLFKLTLGGVEAIDGFSPIKIPILGDIPILGEILFNHSLLVYGAYLLVPVASIILYRTTLGLNIRAVGEKPGAADSLGVNVNRVRYLTVTTGGALAGVAGASLSIALINLFQENMTSGIGFIAVALVYFGGWRPRGVLLGALLFSFVNALQLWIQVKGVNIPSDFALMLPYVLTIVALSLARDRSNQPSALTRPFERGKS